MLKEEEMNFSIDLPEQGRLQVCLGVSNLALAKREEQRVQKFI